MDTENIKYLAKAIKSLKEAEHEVYQLMYDYSNEYTDSALSGIRDSIKDLEDFFLKAFTE